MRKAGDIKARLDRLEARHPPRQADGIDWAAATDAQLRIIGATDPARPTPEQLATFAELPRHG